MRCRLRDSYNVPLPHLVPRLFLLPDRGTPLGLILADGSPSARTVRGAAAPGGSKTDIDVVDFLASRGWQVSVCLEASPKLLAEAEEQGLAERGGNELELQRRWLFHPSRLLLQQVEAVEALLVGSWLAGDAPGDSPVTGSASPPPATAEPGGTAWGAGAPAAGGCWESPEHGISRGSLSATFRMLDLGCGSGRDLSWLSTRRASVPLPACKPARAADATTAGTADRTASGPAAPDTCTAPCVSVAWECVGLDSWHGALQRTADVLALGRVPPGPGPGSVRLHLAEVQAGTGALRPLPLPPPGGAKARKDGGDGTGGAGGSGGYGCLEAYLAATGAAGACAPADKEQAAAAGGSGATALGSGAAACTAKVGAGGSDTASKEPPANTAAAGRAAPGPPALDPVALLGTFDLVLVVRFLERSLLARIASLLRPGGLLLYSTFVDGPGLRAFGRPTGRDHVLGREELACSFFGPAQGFEVLRDEVEAIPDGRELSMFCARKLAR